MIDLDALVHNYQQVVRCAAGRKILAVVKADAYGHGAVEVSRRLLEHGANMLGVALVEEGRALRDAGINAPILMMGALFPEQAEAVVAGRLTPVVFTMPVAHALSAAAKKQGTTIPVHVKIDTGMGRIGILPEEALSFIEALRKLGCITVEGLMTHFADADLCDKQYASYQVGRLEKLLDILNRKGIDISVRHAANSAAVLDFPEGLLTMVRPGLMLYGYNPLAERKSGGADLRPVLSLATRIIYLKEVPAGTPISYGRTYVTKQRSTIATLPIGYADGYSRSLSNKGAALVRGRRALLVGRVCMDMCMLDVTDIPDVREGDDAVLIGSQGKEQITADDIAAETGTVSYEVLCGISNRVPRIYK
jgi:alanine racemase